MLGKNKALSLPIVDMQGRKDTYSNIAHITLVFDVSKLRKTREEVNGRRQRITTPSMFAKLHRYVSERLPYANCIYVVGWADPKCHSVAVNVRLLITDQVKYSSLYAEDLLEEALEYGR